LIEDLQRRSEEGGVVTRNKAKAELEIALAEDSMPLRQAKINLGAAQRKAERAREPFMVAADQANAAATVAAQAQAEADDAAELAAKSKKEADDAADASARAKEEAERSANAAEESRLAAVEAADEAERAAQEATDLFNDACAQLEAAKANSSGTGKGNIWWMERDLKEVQKYLPKRR